MTAYSVLIPFVTRRPEQILPYAGMVAWTDAHRLWQGQSLLVEPHQGFGYAAGVGLRVPVGLGVALMGLRNPYDAMLQARSLAMLTGHPVVAGYGPGARSFQQAVLHRPYRSTLAACREYVAAMRQALGGSPGELVGEYVTLRGHLLPAPAPEVQVGLGVLRPEMARLAGEIADVAITWLTPPAYLAQVVVPALREGARTAGRPTPWVSAIVPVALRGDDRDPVELTLASNRGHLLAPHYRDMLSRAGAGISPDADLEPAAKALIACRGFVTGDLDEVRATFAEYADAGVDEIVINVTGVCARYGQQAAIAELRTLFAAVSHRTGNRKAA